MSRYVWITERGAEIGVEVLFALTSLFVRRVIRGDDDDDSRCGDDDDDDDGDEDDDSY